MRGAIELVWSQRLAASWALSWPAMLGVGAVSLVFRSLPPPALHTLLVAFQVLLIGRLTSKDFDAFYVVVVEEGGSCGRLLSWNRRWRVAIRALAPQVALQLALFILLLGYSAQLDAQGLKALSTLGLWVRILWAGPYGVKLALREYYPGFRLLPQVRPGARSGGLSAV